MGRPPRTVKPVNLPVSTDKSGTSNSSATSTGTFEPTVPEAKKEAAKRTATSLLTTPESKVPRAWNSNDPYSLWTNPTPTTDTPAAASSSSPVQSSAAVTKINNLISGSRNIHVEGRMSLVTPIREFENIKGCGNVFDFTIVDETGETVVTVWNRPEIRATLKINDTVVIKNCTVKECSSQFLNFPASLTLAPNGTVEAVDTEIPEIPFSFASIESTLKEKDGVKTDILAICFKADVLRHVPTQNPRHTVKDIYLTDKSKQVIKMTLWNDDAAAFLPTDYTPIVIRAAQLTSYDNQKVLNKEKSTQ